MAYLTIFAALASLLALVGAVRALATVDPGYEARLVRRMREPIDDEKVKPTLADLLGPRLLQTLIEWGERAGKGGLENDKRKALRTQLVQAGFYSPRAAEAFFGIRAVAALVLGVMATGTVLALEIKSLPLAALIVLAEANTGVYGPKWLLKRRIKARGEAMRLGLPDAIDLMVVAVEAGSTLLAAMQRVQAEFKGLHPVLAEQFGILLMEMKAGASRSEALTRLAERSPIDEVRSLATLLIQSEAVGASLGGTLRVFAEEMRKRRYTEAERKATELPVKIAFPLVFCIFPCLSGVVFIPVIIRFLRASF